jgi:hypothetical protein
MVENTSSMRRMLAAGFAACAVATLTMLANHPGGGALTFADMLKSEAADQFMDGVVHGGFIVTLSALIICFIYLARTLGSAKFGVTVGLVTFCIGAGAMMLSMIADGFATPSVAARFASETTPDKLAMARTILIVFGNFIRFLMPMGLLFQAVAMASWSFVIVGRRGLGRVAGALGILIGAAVIAGVLLVPPAMGEHIMLGAIVLQGIWYLAVAAFLATAKEAA